jgi:hypothetical protein
MKGGGKAFPIIEATADLLLVEGNLYRRYIPGSKSKINTFMDRKIYCLIG